MALQPFGPTEDQVFFALWSWVASLADQGIVPSRVFKTDQNFTATPIDTTGGSNPALASYVLIRPGIMQRQDQQRREYDVPNQQVILTRGVTYSYQVDCYGPRGPDWASIISLAWSSAVAVEWFAGNAIASLLPAPMPVAAASMAPLYADDPQQLNIVNGEMQYEQRYMTRLFVHVTQSVGIAQDTAILPAAPDTWPVKPEVPADLLPP